MSESRCSVTLEDRCGCGSRTRPGRTRSLSDGRKVLVTRCGRTDKVIAERIAGTDDRLVGVAPTAPD